MCFELTFWCSLNEPGREEEARRVERAMTWLGVFDDNNMVDQEGSCLDAMCALMMRRMAYEQDERDMVLLQHQFVFQETDGRETPHVSRLIAYGDDNESAMARTVGTPAAIATKLILDEHVIRRGVLTPVSMDIYMPMLSELEKEGIRSTETSE